MRLTKPFFSLMHKEKYTNNPNPVDRVKDLDPETIPANNKSIIKRVFGILLIDAFETHNKKAMLTKIA